MSTPYRSWCRTVVPATIALAASWMSAGVSWAETGLGRHKQLYAVPAPGHVTIDGKLDDWDLSGQMEMFTP
ncbi:MAG: hypothetical protein ABSF26_16570 [Thermoguttaceae bacterium]|jgi:hypothetical protein